MSYFRQKLSQFSPAPRLAGHSFLVVAAMAALAIPAFAQVGSDGSPFDSTLNALLSFSQGTFAKIAAILAVIFGGWQVVSGDGHGKRALGGLIVGVGLMVYAAPLITWLFT